MQKNATIEATPTLRIKFAKNPNFQIYHFDFDLKKIYFLFSTALPHQRINIGMANYTKNAFKI